MNIQPVTLIGNHVKLVPLSLEHVKPLYEVSRDPEIWNYLSPIKSEEDMRKNVMSAIENQKQGKELPFTILERETERPIGSTRYLDISIPNRHVEIGWTWLSSDVWRTPINTECKFLLLQHSFEELGAIRVTLKTDLRNTRSQKAIERIGGIKEGILRNHRILEDGYIRDTVYYSILDREWPIVKKNLATILERGK
jgi:N-acetyltransferase